MVDFADPITVGYGLIALGVVMFLLEASMPGFFIGVPATILIILGVFALVVPDFGLFTVWAPLVVVVVGLPATLLTIHIYRKIAPPTAAPTTRAGDTMIGLEGRVTVPVRHDTPRGKVKIQQEVWSALSVEGPIPEGTLVRVVRVDGVILFVSPVP